jgi:DNA replication protein DnaC
MASDMLAKLKDARDRGSLFDEGVLLNQLIANRTEILSEIVLLNQELTQMKRVLNETIDRSIDAMREMSALVIAKVDERGG